MLKRNLTHAHNSKVLLFFVHAHKKCFEFIPNDDDDDDDDGKEEDEKIIKITAVFSFLALHFTFRLDYIHYLHEQASRASDG